jgi:hypothetical protein
MAFVRETGAEEVSSYGGCRCPREHLPPYLPILVSSSVAHFYRRRRKKKPHPA